MKSDEHQLNELDALLHKLMEQPFTPEEELRLNTILESSPEARHHYRVSMHVMSMVQGMGENSAPAELDAILSSDLNAAKPSVRTTRRSTVVRVRRALNTPAPARRLTFLRSALFYGLASAALICICVSVAFNTKSQTIGIPIVTTDKKPEKPTEVPAPDVSENSLPTVPAPTAPSNPNPPTVTQESPTPTAPIVAVIRGIVDAEWAAPVDARALDAPLAPGLLNIQAGQIKLAFTGGATMTLEGPAQIKLLSANELYCLKGRMAVNLSPAAEALKISTPEGTFTAGEGEFGLDVASLTTEVHVFKGDVKCVFGSRATTMRQGMTTILQAKPGTQALTSNTAGIFTETTLTDRSDVSLQRMRTGWLNRSKELNADPALLIHYDFEPKDPKDRTLKNLASGPRRLADGLIEGCNWVEGHLPGKGALEFRKTEDRVRLDMPGTHKAITLMAWVAVDGITHQFNGLFMSENWRPGALHWQFLSSGHVRLSRLNQHFETVDSPVVFSPLRLGKMGASGGHDGHGAPRNPALSRWRIDSPHEGKFR